MKYVGSMEPHYGLRKLSIGVASVLLGMSIYGTVGHADPVNISENANVDQGMSNVNNNANGQVVLQGKATSVAPSSQNVEEEGTGKQQVWTTSNVDSDQQLQMNNNATQNVVINDQQLQVNLASQENPKVQNEKIVFDHNFSQGTYDPETNTVSGDIAGDLTWTYTASVDIDASLLSGTESIDLGVSPFAWTTKINGQEVSSNMEDPAFGLNGVPIYIHGQNVGTWNWSQIVPNGTFKGEGMQHISVGNLLAQINWSQDAKQFMKAGYGNIVTTIQCPGASTFTTIIPPIGRPVIVSDQYQYPYSDGLINTKIAWGTLECDAYLKYIMSENAWKQFNHSHGQTVVIDKQMQPYEQAFKLSSDNATLVPSNRLSVQMSIPTVDSDGNVHDDKLWTEAHDFYFKNAGNGLSLKDLENLSADVQGVKMYYSRQTDNSLLFYEYIPAKFFKIDSSREDLVKEFTESPSVGIATDKDPQKAIENSIDYLINKFKRYPSYIYTAFWNNSMDPNIVTNITTTYLDPIDGHVINHGEGHFGMPPKYSSEGQSTVKLHIINSTNGADLSQVKSFTDWPNKGKHAELDLPNITGYQVVANDPASVLSRLHLTGTAITANAQVDYPKENTIADYYIVMEPKAEMATVNIVDDDEGGKVLDSGQVSGKFSAGIVSDDVINAKLQKLLDSGLYTLESNDLEKGLTYKDGAQTVTVKLKHKIDSVQRHYRAIEKLPDGSEKVILDYYATLYKDANAKYYNSDGAFLNGDPQNEVLVHNVYKIAVGHGNDIGADDDGFSEPLDYLPGYHLVFHGNSVTNGGFDITLWDDRRCIHFDYFYDSSTAFLDSHPELGGCTASPLPSQDFYVLYVNNQYPVTINYYDLTGKQISSSTTTHTYLDQVDANALAPKGYVLLTGQDSKLTVGWDHNELDLLVAPAIVRTSQNKAITRTINVENAQGQVLKTVVQTVNFTRDLLTDQVSHQATSTAWQAVGDNEFAAYTPSVIDGYTIDSIASKTVNGDDNNSVVAVRYRAVNTERMSKYVDVNGIGYDKVLDGYEVVKGQDLNKNGILIVKKPTPVIANKFEYVTRTITVNLPNGRTRTIKQRARKGSKFLAVHLPKLRGYRIEITGNVDQAAADGNITASVKFVKI